MQRCRLDSLPSPDAIESIFLKEHQMDHMAKYGRLNEFDIEYANQALAKNPSDRSPDDVDSIRTVFGVWPYYVTYGFPVRYQTIPVVEQGILSERDHCDISISIPPQPIELAGKTLDYHTETDDTGDYELLVQLIEAGKIDCKKNLLPGDPKGYICPGCGHGFDGKRFNWTRHLRTFLLPKEHLTFCCGLGHRYDNLLKHYEATARKFQKSHLPEFQYRCQWPGCAKILFVQHVDSPPVCPDRHQNDLSIKTSCKPPVLSRRAPSVYKLRRNAKSYSCKKCGKTFSSADDLHNHASHCTGRR